MYAKTFNFLFISLLYLKYYNKNVKILLWYPDVSISEIIITVSEQLQVFLKVIKE